MSIQKFKDTVKKVPLLHQTLRPVVMASRQARLRFKLWRKARAVAEFRNYCLHLSQTVAQPVFAKVGANDGLGDDPCSDIFLSHKNWQGLLIEPVPDCFERLRANFQSEKRFILEQLAIGSTAGETTFYCVDPKARTEMPNWEDWFDKLGSFDRQHIVKHANGVLEPYIIEAKVQVRPLSEVLTRHGIKKLHLLHVDAEGYDFEVLKTLDFVANPPLSIFIEYFHLAETQKAEMLRFLHGHGYSVKDCLGDYFAIHEASNRALAR